jgi:inner membrane protein
VIGFKLAFLIAAVPTVALSAMYAGAVFKSKAKGFQALFAFAVVYALMYVLMTLEDQALLAGSLVAFAGIAAVMWLTRDINWYGDRTAAKEPGSA